MINSTDFHEPGAEEFFPATESFLDFAGKRREFVITLDARPNGYFVTARERGADDDGGYEFGAYSPTDPFFALGLVRGRIRRGLATRHLHVEQGRPCPAHDTLRGRVGYGGVVIDGEYFSFESFAELLQMHEGFQFSLTIRDPFDEL